MSLFACFLVVRVRANPLLGHPLPKRLSHEAPAWAKTTAPTTTHSAAASTRFQIKPGQVLSPEAAGSACWLRKPRA